MVQTQKPARNLSVVFDSTQNASFSPDSLPKTYTRDGAGNVTAVSVTNGVSTWVKTYTRDASGNVTAESAWVLQ